MRLELIYMAQIKSATSVAVIFVLVTCTIAIAVDIEQSDEKSCSKWCVNGQCVNGQCLCDPCWSGSKCDQIVDNHWPSFPQKHSKVYVTRQSLHERKTIFHAKANDLDGKLCEPEKPCPCVNTFYKLHDTNDLFEINSNTGELTVNQKVDQIKANHEYDLSVTASSPKHAGKQDELKLKLIIQDELGRVKRQTPRRKPKPNETNSTKGAESFPTSFGLKTIVGETTSLSIGNTILYRLEVVLPRASIDLLLEIYTRDALNKGPPALSLFNFTIPSRVSGISHATPEPIFSISNRSRNVFDRLTVDFGTIKNTGPDRNVFAIHFSVVLVRKPGKDKDNKQLVMVGAEYGKGTFVWVAQSQITSATLSPFDDQVHSNIDISQLPNRIPLDSGAMFQLNANIEFRSDNFQVELSKPSVEYEPDNLISLGRISVTKFGANYKAIPNNASHYISQRTFGVSQLSYSKSVLDMDVITNTGEKNRVFSNNADNILQLSFPVYVLNFEENVGKNATFQAKIILGSKVIWSKLLNITIEPKRQERPTSKLLIADAQFSVFNVSTGGLTQLAIRSDFSDSNGYADYSLIVEVPVSRRTPLLVPCSGRFVNELSGSNVPYLNEASIRPMEESGQYLFNFGRIQFIGQQPNEKGSIALNRVVSEITFRVPFNTEIEDGTVLYANVKAFSGSKSMKVEIPMNEVTIYTENKTGQVEVSTNRSVLWDELVIGGGTGLSLDIELAPNMAYQQFKINVQKDMSVKNLPDLNICRISLERIGGDLPCTCVQKANINENHTEYGRLVDDGNVFRDKASIDLGSISVVNSNYSEGDQRKLMANIIMMVKDNVHEHETYPVLIDVSADGQTIWTERINLTMGTNSSLTDSIRDIGAMLKLKPLEKGNITPGYTTNVMIEVMVKPNSMGPMLVEVVSDDDELSVCGLWIHHIGDNMPCVNKDRKANYQSGISGQNQGAKLRFDTITNFGSIVRRSSFEEKRANTLEFMTMVRVNEAATTNKTIKVILTYGYGGTTIEQDLVLSINGTNRKRMTEFPKPKTLKMKPADGTNITYAGVGKLVYIDIELQENTQVPITFLIEQSNDYKICSASFIKIGSNYPCYSPNSLKVSSSKFELGMICNTFLNKDLADDNLLRLAMALRPNTNIQTDRTYLISSLAYIGPTPYHGKNELQMSVSTNYTDDERQPAIANGATVHAEVSDNVPIRIRQRQWIPFSVRIPPYTTSQLTIRLEGEADESRAIVVLHDLKIISGGANIPCPLDNGDIQLVFNSSVATTQNNIIESNLGYFSNFGFSHSIKSDKNDLGTNKSDSLVQDDLLKMQVLVELTDHPAIGEGSVHKVSIITEYGPTYNPVKRQGQISLTPISIGEPSSKIDVNIRTKKKMDVLDRGDTFTMTATLRHLPESTAEPINPILRMFTPDYIEVIRIDSANTKEMPILMNSTSGTADILFPWILFADEIVVNFTIQIDPNDIRGYGREQDTMITPYRVLCEHFRSESGVKSPCSALKHLQLLTKSSECSVPLGMENGDIADWQISASSAVTSEDYAPTNVRPNSDKFWSPVTRNGRADYLQIDFGRKTRVVRVLYRSVRGMRRVATFHLMYSNDGRVWHTAANRSQITFNKDDGQSVIKRPAEARYYRFVIDEIESNTKTKNQYVAVRLELFGCYLEEMNNETTPIQMETHFSDDPTVINRHVAVDPYTNVLYYCDATLDNHQMCYYTGNGGHSWNVIGRSIDSIEGFELATGKFFAVDYERPAYFSSSDGFTWTPVPFEQFNETVSHTKFHRKMVVPQFHRDDLRKMDIRLGNWRANYDGLFYEESNQPKAFWKSCCGVD